MRLRSWMALGVTGLWILACGGGEEVQADDPKDDDAAEEEAGPGLDPGRIHVEYPAASIQAAAGQFVLAPSRDALDKAAAQGKTGVFIYYAGHIVETGDVESKVKSLAGKEFSIPNSLIIPIKPGYAAKTGDILLGHWESGSGMRRAIVTGGTPTAPVVRYLERAYTEDKAGEQKDDTFKENRFEPLVAAWQVGTTVACKKGSKREHGILTHMQDDQLLVSLFAGKLEPRAKSDCVSLPPRQNLAVGDDVHIPAVGSYTEGKVTKVESNIGRVWVKYTWGGNEKVEAFPIVDVTKSFEAIDEGAENDTPASGGTPSRGGSAAPAPTRPARGQTGQRPSRRDRR